MRMRIDLLFVLSTIITVTGFAQLKPGALGLTTSFSENPNLGLAYAASENTRITATVGFNFAHDSTGNASTYHFAVSIWRYVLTTDNISNFFGGVVGVDAQSNPVGTSSFLDVVALYGAEYWFSTRFAVHGTLQVHFGTGKELGTGVSRIYTSAESGLTWYF